MDYILATAADFFAQLQSEPLACMPSLGLVLVVHVILKKALKGYSRELWFREAKARARVAAGTVAQEETEFLRLRSRRRRLYNGIPLALLVSLPLSFQWLAPLLDAYLPVIASLWLEILVLIFVAMVVSHFDRLFELEQLAKQVRESRDG